jgi:hypothetical protein
VTFDASRILFLELASHPGVALPRSGGGTIETGRCAPIEHAFGIRREGGSMSPSSKRQTTMAKLARERGVKEKRALKQEKREARKRAAEAERAEAAAAELGVPPADAEHAEASAAEQGVPPVDAERADASAAQQAASPADNPEPDAD